MFASYVLTITTVATRFIAMKGVTELKMYDVCHLNDQLDYVLECLPPRDSDRGRRCEEDGWWRVTSVSGRAGSCEVG